MAIKTRRFYSARKSCSCSMPGVWRAVAYMDGAVVVFHSPRACAHVARTMDINSQYRTLSENEREQWGSVPLLSSQMQEKDAIFGGVARLEKCLRFAIETYKPKCLMIANSCVAGVIGDDVESVAREVEEEYNVPILWNAAAFWVRNIMTDILKLRRSCWSASSSLVPSKRTASCF